MSKSARAPRPYTTVIDGRIVWVPAPDGRARHKNVRSRQETDAEVRVRILTIKPAYWKEAVEDSKGQHLDNMLRNLGLPSRQWIDEDA